MGASSGDFTGFPKYRFIEDFPKTFEDYEAELEGAKKDVGSPKSIETKNFGTRMLHRIARCKYEKKKDKYVDEETGEEVEKISIEVKEGELGGWIEQYGNLSQSGECWVHPEGIVCGDAMVSGDAEVKDAELGDYAQLTDRAVAKENAVLKEKCKVFGDAVIEKGSEISGEAEVNAVVRESEVKGRAMLFGGRAAEDDKGALIDKSKIEGKSRFTSYFTITECEIKGNAYVDSCEMEKVKMDGTSFATGVVLGPVKLVDCSVSNKSGNYGNEDLIEALTTSGGTRNLGYLAAEFGE